MAIKRHRRSYVVYPRGYDRDAPGAFVLEFYIFSRARRKAFKWGDGSYIVEWIETFNKNGTTDDCTDREWIVRKGRLCKVTNKEGSTIFIESNVHASSC